MSNCGLRVAGSCLLAILSITALHPASPSAQTPATNLLQNGSFEHAGTPSLDGWRPGNPQLATPISPGGPDGGDWSLRLTADWAPTLGYVVQPVSGLRSGDIVELRADVRAEGSEGGGAIVLITGENWWSGRFKQAATAADSWTQLSVVDTLEIAKGDSVWVQLTSFHTEVVPRVGLFDSVSLTVVGTTPVASATWGSLKERYR